MKCIEELARSMARSDFEKVAGPIMNPAVLGGALLGGAYGGAQGARQSREGEENLGAIGGAALGAIGGAFAGGGARALVKKVPEGWKSWSKGTEALEKEYMAANKITAKPTDAKGASEFKQGFKDYRADLKHRMREAEDVAASGLNGKEARDAIDAVRKQDVYKNMGEAAAGKEQFIGSLIGGGLGLGYGGYQVMNAGSINKADDQEKALEAYVRAKEGREKRSSYEAADHVGRLLARRAW